MTKSQRFYLANFYCILTGIVSVYLGQDFNWDFKNYHLYLPYQLLENRWNFDILAAQIQTFFNPTLDIPFYLAIFYLKLPPVVVGFILGAFQGLNLFFLHLIALEILPKKKLDQTLIFLAVFCAAGGAIFFSQIGTVFGDSTTSVLILFSLLLLISCLKTTSPTKKYIFYAGLLLGIATALKYTNIIHTISVFLAINLISKQNKLQQNFYFLLGSILGFLPFAGYWLWFLWIEFENPVLPFLNSLFNSPYLDQTTFRDVRFIPKTWGQFFFYPFYFLKIQHLPWEMPFRDARLAIGVCSAIFLTILGTFQHKFPTQKLSKLTKPIKFVTAYLLVGYIVWIIIFCYYRYIAPFELISPIIFLALVSCFQIRNYFKLILISIVLITTIAWTKVPNWGRTTWSKDLVGIDQTALQKYENSIVVLWHTTPIAYIIPSFPKSTRFVRIKTNELQLDKNRLLYQLAIKTIASAPKDKLFLLDINYDPNQQRNPLLIKDLANLNIDINQQKCDLLTTKVEKLQICKLNLK